MGFATKGSAFGPKWANVFEMYNWRLAESGSHLSVNGQVGDMFVPPSSSHESVLELGAGSQRAELPGVRAREVLKAMAGDSGGSRSQDIDALRGEILSSENPYREDGAMSRYLDLVFGFNVAAEQAVPTETVADADWIESVSAEMSVLTETLLSDPQDPNVWRNIQMIFDMFHLGSYSNDSDFDRVAVSENGDAKECLNQMSEAAFCSQVCDYIRWAKLDSFAKYYGISERLHGLLSDEALFDYFDEVAGEIMSLIERAITDVKNNDRNTAVNYAASWMLQEFHSYEMAPINDVIDAAFETKAGDQE